MQKSSLGVVLMFLVAFIVMSLYLHYHSLHSSTSMATTQTSSKGGITSTSSSASSNEALHPLREAHPHHWQALVNWWSHENNISSTDHFSTTPTATTASVDTSIADKQRLPGHLRQFLPNDHKAILVDSPTPVITTSSSIVKPIKPTVPQVKKAGTFTSDEAKLHFLADSTGSNSPQVLAKKQKMEKAGPVKAKVTPVVSEVHKNKPIPKPKQEESHVVKFQRDQTPKEALPATATAMEGAIEGNEEPVLTNNRLMDTVKCSNQTRCLQPELQLEPFYNVYYCKHVSYGVRFYFLVREGLLLHPKIRLVEHPDHADIIIYLPESANWKKTECNHPNYWNKTIMLDEGDHQGVFTPDEFQKTKPPGKFAMTFKRSYVRRDDGIFGGYMGYMTQPQLFPMTYTVADAYVRTRYQMYAQRKIDILCTLRGSNWDPVRQRIREWVEEYGKARGLPNVIAGQINSESRTVVSKKYFENMYNAQVIVTSNPSHWEGDFRFCEAMASGALVFIDHMYVPRPKPFVNDKHVIYYSNKNKTDLFEKLDRYFIGESVAKARQQVAMRGYIHAMRYHRAANLIDYVFRTYHTYQIAQGEGKGEKLSTDPTYLKSIGKYRDTGYEMRFFAMRRQRQFEKRKENLMKFHR